MKSRVATAVLLGLAGSALVSFVGFQQTTLNQAAYSDASSAQSLAIFVGKSWEEIIPLEECLPLKEILLDTIESEKRLSKVSSWISALDGLETDASKIEWFFSVEELRNSPLASARISDIGAQVNLMFQLDMEIIEDQVMRALSAEAYEGLERKELSNFEGYINRAGWKQKYIDAFSERCDNAYGEIKFAAEKASKEETAKFADKIFEIRSINWADTDYFQANMFVAYKESQKTKCSGATECALQVFISPVDCTLEIEAQFSSESEYGKSDEGFLENEVELKAFTPQLVEILNSGEGSNFWNLESARCD